MHDAVILDTSHSHFSRLRSVPITDITLTSGFWHDRVSQNRNVTIPSQLQLLESTGRLDNFRRVAGKVNKPYLGFVFNDSDVYKWLEAACWSLAYQPDSELRSWVDQVTGLVASAQDKDGYLNTYFSLEKIRERWMNLAEKHELYCAGHLIQAAIAHQRATNEHKLLDVAVRLADHICNTFGPAQVEGTCGHPEIEMALVELYRATGDKKYLEQAALFIERRGRGLLGGWEYLLDHVPFRQMERLTGHAVRALYLCCGVTDLALETGEAGLKETLERLWSSMVSQQMYITGGVGARYEGEAFGRPYELPNSRAYAETCAAIANLMWNWRLFQMDGNAQYADLMEWALYNAVLPGISLDGKEYFYVNPLKDDGAHRREAWFECACCPPNIARTIASVPGLMYSVSTEGIWLNLYGSSTASIEMVDGSRVALEQTTSYPWDGHIKVRFSELSPGDDKTEDQLSSGRFSVFLRLPAWMDEAKAMVRINGKPYRHNLASGAYLEISREWVAGDTIELDLPMPVRILESHPIVEENYGRIAISRGPLVYCLEAIDNPHIDLGEIRIDPSRLVESEYVSEMLGGMTHLHITGNTQRADPGWSHRLYRPAHPPRNQGGLHHHELLSIPYFVWANREAGAMQIWHRIT